MNKSAVAAIWPPTCGMVNTLLIEYRLVIHWIITVMITNL